MTDLFAAPQRWQLVPIAGHFGEFAALWDELNQRLYRGHPLFESRFVAPLLRHFATAETRLAILGDPGSPRGMLLLEPANPMVWRTFLPSQWQVAPVLLAAEDAALLHGLFTALPLRTCVLDLLNQDVRFSPVFGTAAQGLVLDVQEHAPSMTVRLEGPFDVYWDERSRHLRKNIRKYLKRASDRGCEPVCRVRTEPDAVVDGVREYGLLESAGWKGAAHTAVHPDNVQGAFYRDVLRGFALDGRALFSEMYVGDEFAAARLCVRSRDMLVVLKTTHRESLRDFAPGRVHLYYLLRRLFDTFPGSAVEFYTNADANQLAWASETVEIRNVSLFRSATDRRIIRAIRAVRRAVVRPFREKPGTDDEPRAESPFARLVAKFEEICIRSAGIREVHSRIRKGTPQCRS